MMTWNMDGGAWLGMGVGMLAWLVLAIVVTWLVVRGLLALERPGSDRSGARDAEAILRERFAGGEIDVDEYQRRLALLRGQ
jgi:putative membrane protein